MLHSMIFTMKNREVIQVWAKIVDVQQHFNDISMRIRGLFVTVILAVFVAFGFLLHNDMNIELGAAKIFLAPWALLIGSLVTWLFYFMDRHWYHRLLVGAVAHGLLIERDYKERLPELALSEAIGNASPYEPTGWMIRWIAHRVVKDKRFFQTGRLHSDAKLELFYRPVFWGLLIGFAVMFGVKGVSYNGSNVFYTALSWAVCWVWNLVPPHI
jgi:hypothetical protein